MEELKNLLNADEFNPDSDFVFINKSKKCDKAHSNKYTLVDLNYDTWDVIDRLKELTVEEYSETKLDRDDLNPPLLYVFGKVIDCKLIYIKLKIKGDQNKRVLCVSFHYAKEQMYFPFAK